MTLSLKDSLSFDCSSLYKVLYLTVLGPAGSLVYDLLGALKITAAVSVPYSFIFCTCVEKSIFLPLERHITTVYSLSLFKTLLKKNCQYYM